jgi:probable HAF family extracellular repeat protein
VKRNLLPLLMLPALLWVFLGCLPEERESLLNMLTVLQNRFDQDDGRGQPSTDPNDPNDPNGAVDPNDPNTIGDPNDPNSAVDPNTPSDPNAPADPNDLTDPNDLPDPNAPADPDDPNAAEPNTPPVQPPPLDPPPSEPNSPPHDGCGHGHPPHPDCNHNGVADHQDIAAGLSQDCNQNGVPDECELDRDHDGTIDACDGCPADSAKTAPGPCGCDAADTDTDQDGTPDCLDGCPADPAKTAPGTCGCGVAETDSDQDGLPDCVDPAEQTVTTCQTQFFTSPGQAKRDFTACFTAQGQIGNAATHWPPCASPELALSDRPEHPHNEREFAWQENHDHHFVLVYSGQQASFEVDGVRLQDSFACAQSVNALLLRADAVLGRTRLSNLAVNGQPIAGTVDARFLSPHRPLHILRLGCNLDGAFTLTGTIRFDWTWPLLPRGDQLAFEITAGHLTGLEPPPAVDCNRNGVADGQDIAAGTSQDCNHNGVPDECETDSDHDGTIDACDGCPNDSTKTAPGACGCGAADADADQDGVPDCDDGCPDDATKTEAGACGCGVADTDTDQDGTPDCHDGCPTNPAKTAPGACGCGVPDADADHDGTPDCSDGCPSDPTKTAPGSCGCGVPDTDADHDGTPDCNDGCPDDPAKTEAGACGCGVPDTDTDHDGAPDCNDGCPNDPAKTAPGDCGCGVAETDADGDGTPDCIDGCPADPAKTAPGSCGCGVPDTDSDSDGLPDCIDECPHSAGGAPVDAYGCELLAANAGTDVTLAEIGPVTLHAGATGGSGVYTYAWTASGWAGSTAQDVVVMPPQTLTYTLTVTDNSVHARTAVDTVTVTIQPRVGLHYTITPLDVPNSNGTYPHALNDAGAVVGYYFDADWQRRAFLYSGGAFTSLGTLGGWDSAAHDINEHLQVVGEAVDAAGQTRAFVWDAVGGMRDLGTLGGTNAVAYAVNESGQVAGYSAAGSTYHAFLATGGVLAGLGTQAYAQSGAFDVNDGGDVVGVLVNPGGTATAFLYTNATLYDLGAPLLSQSQAWVINNHGLVAGSAWGSGEDRSFLCTHGIVIDLGTLAGFPKTAARAINDAGQVVGTVSDDANAVSHAFVFTGGALHDLNGLVDLGDGWDYLAEAYSVNSAGQIAGYGLYQGQVRGFVLTPVP